MAKKFGEFGGRGGGGTGKEPGFEKEKHFTLGGDAFEQKLSSRGGFDDNLELRRIEEDFNQLHQMAQNSHKKSKGKSFLNLETDIDLLNDFLDEEEKISIGPLDINLKPLHLRSSPQNLPNFTPSGSTAQPKTNSTKYKNSNKVYNYIYEDKLSENQPSTSTPKDHITSSIKYNNARNSKVPNNWNSRSIRPKIYDEFIHKRNSVIKSSEKNSNTTAPPGAATKKPSHSNPNPNQNAVNGILTASHNTPSTADCGSNSIRAINARESCQRNPFRYSNLASGSNNQKSHLRRGDRVDVSRSANFGAKKMEVRARFDN